MGHRAGELADQSMVFAVLSVVQNFYIGRSQNIKKRLAEEKGEDEWTRPLIAEVLHAQI